LRAPSERATLAALKEFWRFYMSWVFGAVLVLFVSSPLFAQCSPADRVALEALDRAWGEAGQRGDRAYLQSLYAEEYAGLTLTGTQNKATAIDEAVRQAERDRANPQGPPRISYDNYVITCTPNTATVSHRNVVTTGQAGSERTVYSRSVHVFEKRGGRWQLVANAGHALGDAALLTYMENEWNEAYRTRNAAWFERNFADNATSIDSRGALLTKSEEIASLRTDRTAVESMELSDLNVRVEGDVALVTGVNRIRGRDEQGRPMDRRVRFTDTFVRRDGRWVVLATQGTRIESTP
jgi:ketosteroid isomerase-like protein